jgi:hypothetical protein
LYAIAYGIIGAFISTQAFARSNQLDCRGVLFGTPATLSGVRTFEATNALGDGYVRFQGGISAAGVRGRIAYEGYTRTAPFSGVMSSPLGTASIGVLDNTGGRMIIYDGKPSLGAPRTFGEFVCSWR